jgi:hypothetical protein
MGWFPRSRCRPCQDATNEHGPGRFQVDITGMANGPCTACAQLNGTYILDGHGEGAWEYTLPSAVCGAVLMHNANVYLPLDAIAASLETCLTCAEFNGTCCRRYGGCEGFDKFITALLWGKCSKCAARKQPEQLTA